MTEVRFTEPTPVPVDAPPARAPWARLAEIVAEHGKTKVENHTYLQRDTDESGDHIVYSLVLHGAIIAVFDAEARSITVDATNVRTPLTMRRLNTWLVPFGYRVFDRDGVWLVDQWYRTTPLLFTDGMVLKP